MYTSKKRNFLEIAINNDKNDDNPPAKKQKLSIFVPVSNLFKHPDDDNQYKSIYKALIGLNIIPIVSKHIAEFSVGLILECDNYQNCQNKVIMLNKDKLIPNDKRNFYYYNPSNPSNNRSSTGADWKDDNDSTQLFCSECVKKLQKCNIWDKYWRDTEYWFYCSKVFVVNNKVRTCECGKLIKSCNNHRGYCNSCNVEICSNTFFKTKCHYHNTWQCVECQKYVCDSKIKRCKHCEEPVCDDCMIPVCYFDINCRDDEIHVGCKIRGMIDDSDRCSINSCGREICLYCSGESNFKICIKCKENFPICDFCLQLNSFDCPECGQLIINKIDH